MDDDLLMAGDAAAGGESFNGLMILYKLVFSFAWGTGTIYRTLQRCDKSLLQRCDESLLQRCDEILIDRWSLVCEGSWGRSTNLQTSFYAERQAPVVRTLYGRTVALQNLVISAVYLLLGSER